MNQTRTRVGKSFEITLSRDGAASLHAQLVTNLTLQILNGLLKPGDKLPSVRALARRLNIHHNTVSAAYGELADDNLVEIRHGSGVYVIDAAKPDDEGQELDGIIRAFLATARKQGYSLQAIRTSVSNWLARQPPDHLLIVEPAEDLREILVFELQAQLDCAIQAATLAEVTANPLLLTGALTVTTAYHSAEVKRLVPADALMAIINIQSGQQEAEQLKRLPEGAIVGLISLGPTVLDFAKVVIASLRGEQLLVRPEIISTPKKWRSLVRTADLIITDSCCYQQVCSVATRPVLKLSLISPAIVRYLRTNLHSLA